MKLFIKTEPQVSFYSLENLQGNTTEHKNGSDFNFENTWYCLKIKPEYDCKVLGILFDNEPMDCSFLFTGFIHTNTYPFKKSSTYLEANQTWSMWIHGNIGELYVTILNQITVDKLNNDLFNNFMLTVDKPIYISKNYGYSKSIVDFMSRAVGVRWWKLSDENLPYCVVGDKKPLFDPEWAKREVFVHKEQRNDFEWTKHLLYKNNASTRDFRPLDDLPKIIAEYLQSIGYTKIQQAGIFEMGPRQHTPIHTDSILPPPWEDFMIGPKRLYIVLGNGENSHFKMGNAGKLPCHLPLMINAYKQPHAVVNDSDSVRNVLFVRGEICQ